MRIWVTRTAPQAEETAGRLRSLGHSPLVAPVLEVRHVEHPCPELKGVGALAFTSSNGVAAFSAISETRDLPVFAVGEATAHTAREAGFAQVHSARGDVDALAKLIAHMRRAFRGAVLHPGPMEPAGDLVQALAPHGIAARRHAVYATHAVDPPLAVTAALAAEPVELDAVLVHSRRAARRLAELDAVVRAAASLDVFCISSAAAEPLRGLGFRRVVVAPEPDEAALLGLIAR
jgi:uroporphyrinogen-III synthase